MRKFSLYILAACIYLTSCTTQQLPAFSQQHWHVDSYSGNAISSSGLELAFGSEWMITDTTLMQTPERIDHFPKLSGFLANGIAQFPEIETDSILFYNPHRGLLFVTYHQRKSLKPTSEIYLYDEKTEVYSKEYSRLFGNKTTSIDEDGWENGPINSVYTNIRYRPHHKQVVILHRIPGRNNNIAVFQILATNPRRGKWWTDYPSGTFWDIDLGNTDNIDWISAVLHSSQNLAVENLKLIL